MSFKIFKALLSVSLACCFFWVDGFEEAAGMLGACAGAFVFFFFFDFRSDPLGVGSFAGAMSDALWVSACIVVFSGCGAVIATAPALRFVLSFWYCGQAIEFAG